MSSNIEKWKESALFKKLLDDAPNIEKDLQNFNAKYRSFVERDDAAVSVVLRSHLIVEHFLDQYLASANPSIQGWGAARLTFAQKLALAEHPRSKLQMLLPALKCLNALRNRLAHRLDAEFDDGSVAPIREFITVWNRAAGKPIPEGVRLIEEFALQASAWMHSDASMINRHVPEQGLPGLLAWYQEPPDSDAKPIVPADA